ncbi:isovaleryl-CoA dehydrogenase [uncultured Methylibium sp.]|uniref:isovaleryl-CoA dehydrogenase n=1 Tax=uncultured Methylibium sp. TaxID=381093 RepID=UPI0025F27DE1|nr:isovaleryl-CoA dehydrogenase [uncultured Methylibium sp.]
MAAHRTHRVFNQPDPLVDINLFDTDHALVDAVEREGAAGAGDELSALGRTLGSADTLALGPQANENPPRLRSYDRFGHRIDEVEFHPAWHALMRLLVGHGAHSAPWAAPGPGAQVARAAGYLMFAQVENGTQCPVTMTYASVPVIARQPSLAPTWVPAILSRDYDPSSGPVTGKRGALIGMGMTEKQGGTDVRANTTFALPAPDVGGDAWRLTGHKWFLSAPMCDGFLVLAQTERETAGGLTCFFLPRWLPDGSRNAIAIQRLKDKLGNKSNASSEVEFDGAIAWSVGEVGRGVPTILEMGNLTRLDCALGSAGMIRWATANALHHCAGRTVFGRRLIEQPLMQQVLADLALESEAATALTLRLARALDQRDADPLAAALVRIGTPLAKFWICKRGPALAFEAMEVLGGNGYVEEGPIARLYRELPVNSIWEGSGNVMCLDVLRALSRDPRCREAIEDELAKASGANAAFDGFVERLAGMTDPAALDERGARRLAEHLALALQASLLIRGAPAEVADAFCASRLAADAGWGRTFGTLPGGVDVAAILARARPTGSLDD